MDYHQHDQQLKQRLRSLKQQPVRDLAWCCLSPQLLGGLAGTRTLPQLNDHLWPWLHQLDEQPDALLHLLQQRKSTRIGLYYETLWQFYFMQHPEWELLAYNQQIHHQGVTLGAFDFLCRRGDEYWHLETAVKFYLCAATSNASAKDWNQWIGPDQSDRLDRKLDHLRQHQLPLSRHPAAQQWLTQHFPQTSHWQTGLCIQGYFFHRNESQQPDQAHPHYCRGRWLTLRDFLEAEKDFTSAAWCLLERNLWLSPAQTTQEEKLLSTTQLKAMAMTQLENLRRPLLVARMEPWESLWQEDERYFLVPDDWPQPAFM